MDKELPKELQISLKLLKKVVDASEDPTNIQKSLANYTAYVQIEMVVNSYIDFMKLIDTNKGKTNARV
tara:strand:- start:177 stop:380 length:204 start_codon:yes stop_codon:yes gene_type:complete